MVNRVTELRALRVLFCTQISVLYRQQPERGVPGNAFPDLELFPKKSVEQGDEGFEQPRDRVFKQARLDSNQIVFVIPGVFIQTPNWEEAHVWSSKPISEELEVRWSGPIELGKCSHLEDLVI